MSKVNFRRRFLSLTNEKIHLRWSRKGLRSKAASSPLSRLLKKVPLWHFYFGFGRTGREGDSLEGWNTNMSPFLPDNIHKKRSKDLLVLWYHHLLLYVFGTAGRFYGFQLPSTGSSRREKVVSNLKKKKRFNATSEPFVLPLCSSSITFDFYLYFSHNHNALTMEL